MRYTLLICLLLILAACAPNPPAPPNGIQAVTAIPTLDVNDSESLCAAAAENWEQNWTLVIHALEALEALQVTCPDKIAVQTRLYNAYTSYAALLEQYGRTDAAIDAYQSAQVYNPAGAEAAEGLRRLNILTPTPVPGCTPSKVASAFDALPDYTATQGDYVQLNGQGFTLQGQSFTVYGVNYYPRDTPWQRFLTETDIQAMETELGLIAETGINTLRIFVPLEPLFICPGNGAVPVAEMFTRLDTVILAAAQHGFKLIVTLNDSPDFARNPLYSNPAYLRAQIEYLVTRYREEPAILAWDMRDSGDLNYGEFTREAVLNWLSQTALGIRSADPNHLITASWRYDTEATIPAVDFVSFQHFEDAGSLRQRIAVLTSETSKPLLLSATGYNTFDMDELAQRDALYQVFEAAQNNHLAGWVVWTAFDYPLTVDCAAPNCPSPDGQQYHFGLWNTSYFPKLAVGAVRAITGAP